MLARTRAEARLTRTNVVIEEALLAVHRTFDAVLAIASRLLLARGFVRWFLSNACQRQRPRHRTSYNVQVYLREGSAAGAQGISLNVGASDTP